jgi:hypothetical protein
MMADEWGSWIVHDGAHLPPDGVLVQAEFDDADILTSYVVHADETHLDAFLWRGGPDVAHVIRYRIRKPRGLTMLKALLEDLPDPVGPPQRERVS